jgi:DNA-binding SARP family transcriptional activator
MRFEILGPLRVVTEDCRITLSGVNQRAALGYMLLNPNRIVPTSELIHALWNGDSPPTSRKMVQNAMARLRRTLSQSSAWGEAYEIVTRPPGYLLRVPPESIDAYVFQQMVEEGRCALVSGQYDEASKILRAALACWHGSALTDLTESGIAWPQLTALNEAWLDVFEDCVEAELALGHHRELVGEITPVMESEPARERLCGLLILALYRGGRQRDALRLYRRTQLALAEKVGLDPGRELQELEQAILNHDPALAWNGTGRTPRADSPSETEPAAVGSESAGQHTTRQKPCPHSSPGGIVERKRTSALLIRAQRPTVARTDDLEYADASLKVLSQVIGTAAARFGGAVWGTVGSLWCVVFGVPRAREDDPERAVRTVLAVQADFTEALKELGAAGSAGIAIRAAIATGETMVTYQADGDHRPVAVTGEVMDTCQELLSTAPPGEIAICEKTRQAISTDALPDHGAQPYPNSIRFAESTTHFVGREPEMKLLEELLTRVEQWRQPYLVTVLGEAGIGKSRMIAEFAQATKARDGNVRWLCGRSSPDAETDPLRAAADIVLSYAGTAEYDPDAEQKLSAAIRRLMPAGGSEEVLAGLRLLTGLAESSGPEDNAVIFPAWSRFLEEIARTTCVLVFEDLHLASNPLFSFVEHAIDHVGPAPLLIIAIARPELLQVRPTWSGGRAGTTISLGPLSDETTESLLDSIAPQVTDAGLTDSRSANSAIRRNTNLVAQISGNPLFAREYARGLRNGASSRFIPPPETVRSIIGAKIDSLTLCEKVVLRRATIFGDTVWTGGLAALIEAPDDAAEDLLEILERKGFLRRTAQSAIPTDVEYHFCHVLVRDMAYSQLPRADRVDLHLQAAAWVSKLPPSYLTLLAGHYKQAIADSEAIGRSTENLVRQASQALADAGWKAAVAGEHMAAIFCYEGALSMCPADDPLRGQLQLQCQRSRHSLEMASRTVWSHESAGQ